jgi:hypothetical protein
VGLDDPHLRVEEVASMRRIKLLLAAATSMVLMMTVVALPTALAQSYYWDPSWLGSPASTDRAAPEKTTEETLDVEDCRWVLFDDEWFLVCELD